MQYALVNGIKTEACSGAKGFCPVCNSEMIAKCGTRVIHHWAHSVDRNCDPWWENETQWHRDWKELYPEDCREVSHTAENGEIHRADITTPTGIVIEVQHSSMSDAERISREGFYRNLVWVLDGSVFEKNFDVYHMLPCPRSEVAQDLIWSKAKRNYHGANRGLFFRLSEILKENPKAKRSDRPVGQIFSIHDISSEVEANYRGHHQYDWVRPRKTWLDAASPVYIDFGEDHLLQLQTYDNSGLRVVQMVAKRKFIHDTMTETDARKIATRFYKLPKVKD